MKTGSDVQSGSFPTTLRELRMLRGLSTTEAAYRIGVQQSTLVRLEQSQSRGTASQETIQRCAAALGFEYVYRFEPIEGSVVASVPQQSARRNPPQTVRRGSVGAVLEAREIAAARKLTGVQRMRRALEMSDLSRKLACLKQS